MKILVVVNPISGGYDKSAFIVKAKRLCQLAQVDCTIYRTTGNKDHKSIQELLNQQDFDRLIAVGGDGTVNLLIPLLIHYTIPLGIVPMGSANGLATDLAIDTIPENAFNTSLNATHYVNLDVIEVNQESACVHIGDIGANAQLISQFEKDNQRGMLAYFNQLVKGLGEINPFEVQVSTPESSQQFSAVMVAICNSRKYGTGIPLNNISKPTDGKFELVIIEKINIAKLLQAGLASINKNWLKNPTIIQSQQAQIQLQQPQLLQLDGELIAETDTIDIRLKAKAIQTIVDAKNIPYQDAIKSFS